MSSSMQRWTAAAVLGLVAGCGGSASPDELMSQAMASKQSGDHSAAAAAFENVAKAEGASDSQKFQAARELVVCKAHTGGDGAAGPAFASLRKSFEATLDLKTVTYLIDQLSDAGSKNTAFEVIEYATPKFGGDAAAKKKLEKYAAQLMKDDVDLKDALGALGYLGDDEAVEDDEPVD